MMEDKFFLVFFIVLIFLYAGLLHKLKIRDIQNYSLIIGILYAQHEFRNNKALVMHYDRLLLSVVTKNYLDKIKIDFNKIVSEKS